MDGGIHADDLDGTIESMAARLEGDTTWESIAQILKFSYAPAERARVAHDLLFWLAGKWLDAGQDRDRVSHWLYAHETPANAAEVLRRLQKPSPGLMLTSTWLFASPVHRGLYAEVWKLGSPTDSASCAAVKLVCLNQHGWRQ